MDDLIYTLTAYYGATFTIVIIAALMTLAIGMALIPFFMWSIHNQTSLATKELTRLNKLIEGLIPKQLTYGRLKEGLSKERRANEIIFEEKKITPLIKEKPPEQKTRRKKVFHKPDDELPGFKKKSS